MIDPSRLIVALDLTDRKAILQMAERLAPHVGMFKVGPVAFTAHGPDLVRELIALRPLFLDLKFHDIPNTVEKAVMDAAELGVKMLTIHASGGSEMVKAAAAAARAHRPGPRVLAVTVLTHMRQTDLDEVGVVRTLDNQVSALAAMAEAAGAHGIVASPRELPRLRQELGEHTLLVVPGIRPAWALTDDQRRAETPAKAITAGADYLVIGRPILTADDPVEAVARILAED